MKEKNRFFCFFAPFSSSGKGKKKDFFLPGPGKEKGRNNHPSFLSFPMDSKERRGKMKTRNRRKRIIKVAPRPAVIRKRYGAFFAHLEKYLLRAKAKLELAERNSPGK